MSGPRVEPMRRPMKISMSSVASSAQWASSMTTTVSRVVSWSRNVANMVWRALSAAITFASSPPDCRAMSRSGPSGRGVRSESHAPQSTGRSVSSVNARTRVGLSDARLAGDEDDVTRRALSYRIEKALSFEQLHVRILESVRRPPGARRTGRPTCGNRAPR